MAKIFTAIISIFFLFISFEPLLAQETNMTEYRIYEEITSLAKQEGWKMSFFGSNDKGNNVLKIHNFRTGEVSTIYEFPNTDDLIGFIPSISHHGDKIGFWVRENAGENLKNNSLYIINSDGSNLKKLITIADGYSIFWSLDDKKIAFGASLTGNSGLKEKTGLYLIDIKSRETKIIMDNQSSGDITGQSCLSTLNKFLYGYKENIENYKFSTKNWDWVVWSPDVRWIAYLEDNRLSIINLETLEKQVLVENTRITAPIYWLPNGEYIVYGAFTSEHAEIGEPYVIRISDKKTEPISDSLWMLASWAKGQSE